MTAAREIVTDQREQFAFHDDIAYLAETKRGLTRATVEEISAFKNEPDWMLQYRLRAYEHFLKRPMPTWTDGLDKIDFDKIVYYRKPSEREEKSWDDVPDQIKATFERLGIPEAERKFLAGVGAQYDSEVVYHSVKEELSKLGVVFMGTDQALVEYPEIFRKHFGTVVLRADAGQELALRLGDAEPLERRLDLVRDVVPRLLFALGGLAVVDDLVEVDLVEAVGPGRHRALEEVLVGAEAELEHPVRLVLEPADLLDRGARQPALRLGEVAMSSWKANWSRWSVTISRVAVIGSPVVGGATHGRRGGLSRLVSNSDPDYRD